MRKVFLIQSICQTTDQGFKKLGADGWRLVQVIEKPAAEGVYDGPVAASTHCYFTRPARSKG